MKGKDDFWLDVEDKVIKLIARNRKTLIKESNNGILNIEQAVDILGSFLTKNKVNMTDIDLRKMIKFA